VLWLRHSPRLSTLRENVFLTRAGFVIPSLQEPSGWRTASLGILRAVRDELGIQPILFVASRDRNAAQVSFPRERVFVVPETQDMSFESVRSWPKLARTRRAVLRSLLPRLDFVHSLDAYSTGLVGHWIARRCGIPHIVTALGTYAVRWSSTRVDRWFYSRVLSRASLVCPMSHGTLELMAEHFPKALARTPTQVVHLGSDFTERVPTIEAEKRREPDERVLLSVGALKPRKGLDLTISAFALVQREFPSARLIVVGEDSSGRYKHQLLDHVRQTGATNVVFVSHVSEQELRELYRNATAFILTPKMDHLHFEGFGLVYLEAGAFGLPVVATRSGGVPDAVKDGVTGLLAPEDARSIAANVLRLFKDPELARTLGKASRAHAETFTWQRFAENQLEAYRLSSPAISVGTRTKSSPSRNEAN
jgi:phosphatidylinositol alpha-1,6-mannosyltransferase